MTSALDLSVAALSGGGGTLAVQTAMAWYKARATARHSDRTVDARLEEHRDNLTFDLLKAAREEMDALRQEASTLRPLMSHVAHLEESLDHLHAILHAEGDIERRAAERRAKPSSAGCAPRSATSATASRQPRALARWRSGRREIRYDHRSKCAYCHADRREGGYANNPADKGGPTMWGITEQVARAHGYTGAMSALPRDTAIAIYLDQFWTTPHFDLIAAIEPTIGAELLDAGANMGTATAGKFVQRALNLLNREHTVYPDLLVDGQLGAVSRSALTNYRRNRADAEGLAVLLWMMRSFRTERYAEIAEATPSQEEFEYGRVARQVRSVVA